jgi:hypothetical protein
MEPTTQYIAAPEQIRSRCEANSGHLVATVENIGDRSYIYVSHDGGLTEWVLEWEHDIWAGLKIWFYEIAWPPVRIRAIKSLDDQKITILYTEPQWSEPDIFVYATYDFKEKEWHLKLE